MSSPTDASEEKNTLIGPPFRVGPLYSHGVPKDIPDYELEVYVNNSQVNKGPLKFIGGRSYCVTFAIRRPDDGKRFAYWPVNRFRLKRECSGPWPFGNDKADMFTEYPPKMAPYLQKLATRAYLLVPNTDATPPRGATRSLTSYSSHIPTHLVDANGDWMQSRIGFTAPTLNDGERGEIMVQYYSAKHTRSGPGLQKDLGPVVAAYFIPYVTNNEK